MNANIDRPATEHEEIVSSNSTTEVQVEKEFQGPLIDSYLTMLGFRSLFLSLASDRALLAAK